MAKRISELSVNPKNPRKITADREAMLKEAVHEFGDLGCIVFNRVTQSLVGGHQRVKVLDPSSKIKIEKEYDPPSRTGTVAEGFILVDGERLKYREVLWDRTKEKAAALAANRNAGDWDYALVGDWLRELESDGSFDLDKTMFSKADRDNVFGMFEPKEKKPKPEKTRSSSDDVKQVNLTFNASAYEEFSSHVQFFQEYFNQTNVSDTLLELLKATRESCESDEDTEK